MLPLPVVLLPGLDGTGDLFEPMVAVTPPSFAALVPAVHAAIAKTPAALLASK